MRGIEFLERNLRDFRIVTGGRVEHDEAKIISRGGLLPGCFGESSAKRAHGDLVVVSATGGDGLVGGAPSLVCPARLVEGQRGSRETLRPTLLPEVLGRLGQ